MFGLSEIFDVTIGLVFIILLFSILATWGQEFLAGALGWRSKHLVNAIENLLDPSAGQIDGVARLQQHWSQGVKAGEVKEKLSENMMKAMYEHPMIKGLSLPDKLPSYIPAREFGLALMDLFTKAGTPDPSQVEMTLDNLKAGIENVSDRPVKEALLSIIRVAEATEESAEKQMVAVRQGFEAWFDATMDRASGWYKRKAQWWSLAIGLVIAIAFNVDVFSLAGALWQDPTLRSTTSAAAVAYIEQGQEARAIEARQQLEALGLPVGWTPQNLPPATPGGWPIKILGWLISGAAISQGSPFWFDVLNRFTNLRGSGKKPAPASGGGG